MINNKPILDYTKHSLRLDDAKFIKDYSVRIKRVKKNDIQYVIIINLHINKVIIIEYYDKHNDTKDDKSITMDSKRIIHEEYIFGVDNIFVSTRVHISRKPLGYKIDYQYYSIHDEWAYINELNNDALDPSQVTGIIENYIIRKYKFN